MGVWIETLKFRYRTATNSHTLRGCVDWNKDASGAIMRNPKSHPAWVCGLKLKLNRYWTSILMSHPAWVCGLKPIEEQQVPTPHCHTLRGCVDWNSVAYRERICIYCHTLRGCVDWNVQSNMQTLSNAVSHPAWVCGLKQGCRGSSSWSGVTPCVGVWIETKSFSPVCISPWVTPCVGVWIETAICDLLSYLNIVTPCVGVWIETMTRWIRV